MKIGFTSLRTHVFLVTSQTWETIPRIWLVQVGYKKNSAYDEMILTITFHKSMLYSIPKKSHQVIKNEKQDTIKNGIAQCDTLVLHFITLPCWINIKTYFALQPSSIPYVQPITINRMRMRDDALSYGGYK